MDLEKAKRVFKDWQKFVEINDKLGLIFSSIPKSFLPYPPDILEGAMNAVAEDYFNAGDHKTAEDIQNSIVTLIRYEDDSKALESMLKKLKIISEHPDLRDTYLNNLKRTRDSWAKLKQ
jgi:hypothetical protein